MQNQNANDKRCYDKECRFIDRPHYHVVTNDGEYVKYIIEKPKYSREIKDHADTW